jgi:protein SCO1/2
MTDNRHYPKMLIYAVAAMLILGALAIIIVNRANKSRSEIPIYGTLSNFSFTNANTGQPFGLEQMKGKINVVDFMFTNCRSACPIMVVNMAELYDLYKDFDQVQFVSISVDPERDSLEALRQYAADHDVTDNRWVFLRAPIEDVVQLCEKQFMLGADGLPMGHTTKFILVDQQGRIRGYYEGLDNDSLTPLENSIRQLARNPE